MYKEMAEVEASAIIYAFYRRVEGVYDVNF